MNTPAFSYLTIENRLFYPEIQPRKIQLQSRQSQIDLLESEMQRIETSEDSCRSDLRDQKSNYTSLEEKYNLLVKSESLF